MSQKLEAFVVTEQLSGREVRPKKNEKSGNEWYVINYPELREKNLYTNVSFGSRSFTMSGPAYEGTKLKHIIETQISEFKPWVHAENKVHDLTTKTGRIFQRDFVIVHLRFKSEEDCVDCWNRIFELLFKEDYLEMSVRLLEEAVEKLKKEGNSW